MAFRAIEETAPPSAGGFRVLGGDVPPRASVGMGDVQEAARVEQAGAGNVPVALLTGDKATDRQIAQNFAAQGMRHALTPGDALRAGAVAASMVPLSANPLLAGAAGGALYSAGTSPARDLPGFAGDVATGAGTGAAMGGALKLAGRAVSPLANWLDEHAIKYGRNAISGITSSLARRKPLEEAAVRQAFDVGAIAPGSNVQGIARRLQDVADPLAERYGQILSALEAKGVHGPEAETLAQKLAAEASSSLQNEIVGTRSAALQDAADKLSGKALPISGQGRMGLMQTELMKRELQAAAASDFVKEGNLSLSGHARKELAGTWKDAIEQAVQDQAAKAPEEAAQFQPVKEELHRTLQALGAAREGAARYARRSPFGLHEAMGMATGIATGNPLEAAGAAGVMHALKDRGASTGAWLANEGAGFLGRLPQQVTPETMTVLSPAASGAAPRSFAEYLAEALRRSPVRLPAAAGAEDEGR